MMQRLGFIASTSLVYGATVAGVMYMLQPPLPAPSTVSRTTPSATPNVPVKFRSVLVSGAPTRIVIPDYGIDLAVDPGSYDAATGNWTLGDTRAYFAQITAPANNHAGNTLLYGHGTDTVFGKLGAATVAPGTTAWVDTATHRFTYRLVESRDVVPNDTSVFDDAGSGPPRLTVQTCVGSLSEWRRMFVFYFEKVVQR